MYEDIGKFVVWALVIIVPWVLLALAITTVQWRRRKRPTAGRTS